MLEETASPVVDLDMAFYQSNLAVTRPSRAEDSETIYQIYLETMHDFSVTIQSADSRRNSLAQLEDPRVLFELADVSRSYPLQGRSACMVAETDGQIRGFLCVTPLSSTHYPELVDRIRVSEPVTADMKQHDAPVDVVTLKRVHVLSKHRHNRIAWGMLETVLSWCKLQGFTFMHTSFHCDNVAMKGLCNKLQARMLHEDGEILHYIWPVP